VAQTDFVGTGIYVLADGSKLPSPRFVVRELKVGGYVVSNVTASVGPVKGELLLGQSFLAKLPPWSIDYQKNALEIRGDTRANQAPIDLRTQSIEEILGPKPPQAPPASQSSASRWVDLRYSDRTRTYDLETIVMILPGRFTVLERTVDLPEVMRFRLKVLDTLRPYCSKSDGKYEPPNDLFLLGTPDMPIGKIEVSRTAEHFKHVIWESPYGSMAIGDSADLQFFDCEGPNGHSPEDEYNELRAIIMNGITSKELYDCNNGVFGIFASVEEPLAKAITTTNITGAYQEAYLRLCRAITGETPYIPPDAK
jgi:hypothetical protein